jgi:hypothetical protein
VRADQQIEIGRHREGREDRGLSDERAPTLTRNARDRPPGRDASESMTERGGHVAIVIVKVEKVGKKSKKSKRWTLSTLPTSSTCRLLRLRARV